MRPALVLGSSVTALGVVRALGLAGIPVQVLDSHQGPAAASRYASFAILDDPRRDRSAALAGLAALAARQAHRPVLHITSDHHLDLVARERHAIAGFADFGILSEVAYGSVVDKQRLHELAEASGVPSPHTMAVSSPEEVERAVEQMCFPAFVKGRDSVSWRSSFGPVLKGWRVDSRTDLQRRLQEVVSRGVPVVAQEMIPGPDSHHYKVSAVLSKASRLLAAITSRKIRQSPPRAGIGCVMETVAPGALQSMATEFFCASRMQGVVSAEFKLDARDDRFKLIEINPRYWLQNGLALAAGCDVARLHHLEVSGSLDAGAVTSYTAGIKWIDLYRDFDSFRDMRAAGELGLIDWVRSLGGPRCWASFSMNDPSPWLYSLRSATAARWTRLFGQPPPALDP